MISSPSYLVLLFVSSCLLPYAGAVGYQATKFQSKFSYHALKEGEQQQKQQEGQQIQRELPGKGVPAKGGGGKGFVEVVEIPGKGFVEGRGKRSGYGSYRDEYDYYHVEYSGKKSGYDAYKDDEYDYYPVEYIPVEDPYIPLAPAPTHSFAKGKGIVVPPPIYYSATGKRDGYFAKGKGGGYLIKGKGGGYIAKGKGGGYIAKGKGDGYIAKGKGGGYLAKGKGGGYLSKGEGGYLYKGKGKGGGYIYKGRGGGYYGKGKGKKSKKYGGKGYDKYTPIKKKIIVPIPFSSLAPTVTPTKTTTMAPFSSADVTYAPVPSTGVTMTPTTGGVGSSSTQQNVPDPAPVAPPAPISVELNRFQLTLTVATSIEGESQRRFDELEEATFGYLDAFYADSFDSRGGPVVFDYNRLELSRVGGTNNNIHVFDAEVFFNPGSRVPPDTEMNNALEFAFTTARSEYLRWLEESLRNEYSATTAVSFAFTTTLNGEITPDPASENTDEDDNGDLFTGTIDDNGESTSNTATVAAASASAGVFLLLLGGLAIFRRSSGGSNHDAVRKLFDEVVDGHITVAETYAGETYAGTSASGDNQSVTHHAAVQMLTNSNTNHHHLHHNKTSSTPSIASDDHDDQYGHHNDDSASVKSSSSAGIGAADWNDFQRVLHPDPMSEPEYDNMHEALSRGRSQCESYEEVDVNSRSSSSSSSGGSGRRNVVEPTQQQYRSESSVDQPINRLSKVQESEEEEHQHNHHHNNNNEENHGNGGDIFSDEYHKNPDPPATNGNIQVMDDTKLEDVQL